MRFISKSLTLEIKRVRVLMLYPGNGLTIGASIAMQLCGTIHYFE
jgi:hypothetical protein